MILSRGGALHLVAAMLTAAKSNSTEQVGSEERRATETALTASRGKVVGESGAAKKPGVPASTPSKKSFDVAVTGSNFTTAGTTVAVSGTGVTVSAVTAVNPAMITATFTISATGLSLCQLAQRVPSHR